MGEGEEATSSEGVVFPATVTPPSSPNSLLLLGNGITDMTIESIHVKFTEIAVYMETTIMSYLGHYKGWTRDKLLEDTNFYKDMIDAPIEKFVKIVIIKGIKGSQYGSTLESSIRDKLAYDDTYEEEEDIALEELTEFFRTLNLETRTSIQYRWPAKSMKLEVTYSSDGSIPQKASYVVDNPHVSLAILDWIIGERSISLSTITSIAENILNMV